MRKPICFFAFLMAILCFNLTATKAIAGDKTNNCFPVARLVATPVFICDNAAFSLLVEGGPRSYRFNGTLGFINDCNRFKLSAEHLSQRLGYRFDSGKTHRWMHQLALGGQYQYLFECPCFLEGLQLGINYSNAPSKSLSAIQVEENEYNFRRIAGSWHWTLEAGFITNPWDCAKFIATLTYDQVRYRREHQNGKRISGVGFTLDFCQRFYRNFIFDINYQFKQAYTNLGASLRWVREFACGDLDIGIFAYHVWGKRRLPSSTTAGVELGFAFGICGCNVCGIGCGCDPCNYDPYTYDACDLVAFVSRPAVYMPQVLAIVDQEFEEAPGLNQNFANPFPSESVKFGGTSKYETALYFTGKNPDVEFSATGLPEGASIDAKTGVISFANPLQPGQEGANGTIFVTATGRAGTETSSFNYTFEASPSGS